MDGIGLSRSLSTRLDNLKVQYKGELVSLIDERESLFHEIAELQTARDVFLEETTMLNARNEELAQLNAHYMRRIEAISSESSMPAQEKRLSERERERQHPPVALQSSHTVNSSIGASSDEGHDLGKYMKSQQKPSSGDAHSRVFKWRGNNKDTNAAASAAHTQDGPNEKTWPGHTFQQVSVLRISKCDHCSEKLWGSQARCQGMCLGSSFTVSYSRSALHAPPSLPHFGASSLSTERLCRLFATTQFSPGRRICTGYFTCVCLCSWTART